MTLQSTASTIRFQILMTFTVLSYFYILNQVIIIEDSDVISQLIYIIFQPVRAITVCLTSIIICFIIGLPIRLIPAVHTWWIKNPVIQLLLMSAGLFILLYQGLDFDQPGTFKLSIIEESDLYWLVCGWFTFAFSVLHFYPTRVSKLVKRKTYKFRSSPIWA